MARRTSDEDSDGAGAEFPGPIEYAIAILEDLPAAAWARITELTAANLRGQLSYEAWRAACGALITHHARRGRWLGGAGSDG